MRKDSAMTSVRWTPSSERDGERVSYLWITPKWPLPANDGARIATVNLIQAVSRLGAEVDLVAIAGADEPVDATAALACLGVRSASVIRREPTSRSIPSMLRALATSPNMPLTMRYYATPDVRRELAGHVAAHLRRCGASAVILFDGLHTAAACADVAQLPAPVIYRAHNREADLWDRRRQLAGNPLVSSAIGWQARLVRRFEDAVAAAAQALAPVSAEDLRAFQPFACAADVVPIGYAFADPPPRPGCQPQLMFIGRLDWPPNRDGLLWLLEHVWPKASLARPDLSLCIAGSGNGAWLEPYRSLRGVTLLGRVEEVADLYARSAAAIVPIFYGSGTRVKVIEACRYGRACISTSLGVEGTGLQPSDHYMRAESAAEWIEVLSTLELDGISAMGARAHAFAAQAFDMDRAGSKLNELAGTLLRSRMNGSALQPQAPHAG